MARRLKRADGSVAWVEFSRDELAAQWRVSPKDLADWHELIPCMRDEAGAPVYRFESDDDLRLARQRAGVLRTRMSPEAVRNVEREGMLDAYYKLSLDCPAGITAHVYRSYVVLLVLQQRGSLMLDADGLAERAQLNERDPDTGKLRPSPDLARKHLRLLQAVGILRHGGERWEFTHVPRAIRGAAEE